MKPANLTSIKRRIARCLTARAEVQAGYIFGSIAAGRARPDSDIDIAVLLDRRIDSKRLLDYRLKLMGDLGAALHRSDVDVVILNQATPLLAHRILSRGRLVFERSAAARVRFQVRTASRYLDLVPMFETHIRYLKKSGREDQLVG